jgi:hypothetical protein
MHIIIKSLYFEKENLSSFLNLMDQRIKAMSARQTSCAQNQRKMNFLWSIFFFFQVFDGTQKEFTQIDDYCEELLIEA